jgi:hypothetical protein
LTDGLISGGSRIWPFLAGRGSLCTICLVLILIFGEQGHLIKTSIERGLSGKIFFSFKSQVSKKDKSIAPWDKNQIISPS